MLTKLAKVERNANRTVQESQELEFIGFLTSIKFPKILEGTKCKVDPYGKKVC